MQLKSENGAPLNVEIPNRKTLYFRVAQLVPRHSNRQKDKEKDQKGATSGGKNTSSGGKNKQHQKKGKKGRR